MPEVRRTPMLMIILASYLMLVLDISIVITALPTLALLTATFPEGPERTRAVAYYGAVAGGGTAIGLVLGGVLTDWLSRRSGFFINVPIGAALIVAALRCVHETPRRSGRFDLLGAISATLGMSSLVYGIVRSGTAGWSDGLTLAALAAGIMLLALFVLNESRAEQPITPLRLFAHRERTGAYLARFLFIGANFSFLFFFTQYLQSVDNASPLEAGLAFLPLSLASFAWGMNVPRLAHRFGNAAACSPAPSSSR